MLEEIDVFLREAELYDEQRTGWLRVVQAAHTHDRRKLRKTPLFRSHEQAELVGAIADTRAMFEGKGWA